MFPVLHEAPAANGALLTPEIATNIFSSMWGVITANFAGVAILLGSVAGLVLVSKLINGAKKGKVKV